MRVRFARRRPVGSWHQEDAIGAGTIWDSAGATVEAHRVNMDLCRR